MRRKLDTGAYNALRNPSDSDLGARVRRPRVADVGLPAPVAYELYYGAFTSRRRDENMAKLDSMAFEIVPVDESDARAAGAARAAVKRSGLSDHPRDAPTEEIQVEMTVVCEQPRTTSTSVSKYDAQLLVDDRVDSRRSPLWYRWWNDIQNTAVTASYV